MSTHFNLQKLSIAIILLLLSMFLPSFRTHLFKYSARNMSKVRSTASSGSQVYESKRAVDEYLLFHYGEASDLNPFRANIDFALDFAERSSTIAKSMVEKSSAGNGRVLDIGCAVGGLSFALSKHFEEVIGIDYSAHFVAAAEVLKEKGMHEYSILKQGDIFEQRVATISSAIDRSKVHFTQGDACHLQESLGKLSLVFF
jgi:tRNA/tmRNA/rRNA uracil-C5-methylase (TrmA/RlmC/RlmD family)